MTTTFIVVDHLSEWSPFAESEQVIDFESFISSNKEHKFHQTSVTDRIQIINLCKDYSYLSKAYYCSLLAESRGFRVSPSLKSLGMYNRPEGLNTTLPNVSFRKVDELIDTSLVKEVLVIFGNCQEEMYQKIARQIYSSINFPILRLIFSNQKTQSAAKKLKEPQLLAIHPTTLDQLNDSEESFFAEVLEKHSQSIWRIQNERKVPSLSLAILIDDGEPFPPSDKKALKQFKKMGQQIGFEVTFLRPYELARLGEFDALFIRATTAVNHFTYTFAVEAKRLGIAVIDDPESILKCTNKVFLMQLFNKYQIVTPKTILLSKDRITDELLDNFEYPTVLKIPDGSFSRGVVRAKNPMECKKKLDDLFKGSELVLQQEYLFTDFDWRIGILNKMPIYASKYEMAKGHWQIVNHNSKTTKNSYGLSSAESIRQVPAVVIKTAVQAASLIGDGLYGVDIKLKDNKAYVIEVNDNPSIDYGVEDALIGDELYRIILTDFLRRIYQRNLERPLR